MWSLSTTRPSFTSQHGDFQLKAMLFLSTEHPPVPMQRGPCMAFHFLKEGGKKIHAEHNLPGYTVIIHSRLSQLQVRGILLRFVLTKYISLLYLHPLRNHFFFTSWYLILCLWAISCRQAQTVLPSKSNHVMTCEWKVFQIKENRKVQ